ncbi:MAG: hypothetical protein RL693_553 [Verrucomicrobiota bacterium]
MKIVFRNIKPTSAVFRCILKSAKRSFSLWPVPTVLLLAPLAALHAAEKPVERVAVLLREQAWPHLAVPLENYLASVKRHLPVEFEVIHREWKTPESVREEVRRLHRKKGVSGVILLGAMPMHRFFMQEFANPNPLYYEDYNLKFVDRNQDGFDDAYRGTAKLKLWVANIRSSEKHDDDDVEGLTRFFAKATSYHEEKLSFAPRGLIITDWKAPDWETLPEWKMGCQLYGRSAMDVLDEKKQTPKNAGRTLNKKDYAFCMIGVHSDHYGHALYQGDWNAPQIASMKQGAALVIAHCCFAANWNFSEKENTGPCTAQCWLFGKGSSLAMLGQVRSGCIGTEDGRIELCRKVSEGEYLGKAYKVLKQSAEEADAKGEQTPGDLVSGVLLLGDPFLTLPRKPGLPDPKQ